MRCKICDEKLTLSELNKKDNHTGTFSDTCYRCDGVTWESLREFESETPKPSGLTTEALYDILKLDRLEK
tara:strand:+ start:360 stop:569 length:210 start_codon:yes stop_codon:yes gene_type:complete